MTDKVLKAVDFAAKKHINQRRKNTESSPYINHPIDVANTLAQCGVKDVDVLCAALLHDTVEDTQTTFDEITFEFGEKVANIVRECTDDKSLPKHVRKQLQIEHAAAISKEGKLVKLADKLSNIGDLSTNPPKSWTTEEINGYICWAFHCYLALKNTNELLEQGLLNVFSKFGVTEDSDRGELALRLESYYQKMKDVK